MIRLDAQRRREHNALIQIKAMIENAANPEVRYRDNAAPHRDGAMLAMVYATACQALTVEQAPHTSPAEDEEHVAQWQ